MPSCPSQQQLRVPARNMHERLSCRKAIPDNHPALSILVGNSLGDYMALIDGEAVRRAAPLTQPFTTTIHHPPAVSSPLTAPLCLAIFLPFLI
jgi:hypothetical protein